jgi:hypothetical protein
MRLCDPSHLVERGVNMDRSSPQGEPEEAVAVT